MVEKKQNAATRAKENTTPLITTRLNSSSKRAAVKRSMPLRSRPE